MRIKIDNALEKFIDEGNVHDCLFRVVLFLYNYMMIPIVYNFQA